MIWDITKEGGYDVVAHDEAYEVITVLFKHRTLQCCKSAFMSDYFGYWGPTKGLKAKIVKRAINNLWLKGITKFHDVGAYMLLCEREDIPNQKMGFMMPNAQDLVGQDFVEFTGYPVTFDPKALPEKGSLRKEYGLGQGPLILVTIGGTNVGKPLLELCVKAFPSIRGELPDATMVLVGGPNLDPDPSKRPEGVLARGYIPDLYRLMAACDIGICSGGSTTTLEFMALQKPFLYFPLQRHFEQQIIVAGRNERLGAGKKMQFPQTTPELLKKAVLENIGTKVELPKAGFQGVQMAGAEIAALL